MTTHAVPRRPAAFIPRPELDVAGKISIAFLILLGIGALAGGIALAMRPDGSVMNFEVGLLEGSPFTDYFVPGLILGGGFGIGSLVVAAMGLRRSRLAPFLAFAIGSAQMIWIVVELAIIQEVSFLHPVFFGIGLVIAVSAVAWGWPTFRAWRTSR
jgi:hypothetical protein